MSEVSSMVGREDWRSSTAAGSWASFLRGFSTRSSARHGAGRDSAGRGVLLERGGAGMGLRGERPPDGPSKGFDCSNA